ncbi:unnamed protein product [Trypanosoma congolense IL3000]|uniref:WGS project CAEQ00000000 data, annotated contig 784 n=1 Tax=Trypanosoma congolense (strain IL3000) TaxID=1068625 RepID=F9WIG2_TRYCI|nr:unnamed protein product [Trypanosoma congolense IL3000]
MLKLGVGIGMMGWVMVMVVVAGGTAGGTGTGSNGECQLNENAAGLLCAIAKLVEKAKNITHNHDYKNVHGTWDYVALHKEQVDYRVDKLPGLIEEAKAKKTLTAKEAEDLTPLYLDAHNKNTQQHNKSKAAIEAHNRTHAEAKNSTAWALGEGYVTGNCNMVSSLLGILQCYVKGSQPEGNPNVETLCKEKSYRLDESHNTLLTNCNKIGKGKTYCNGTGAALKAALDKWNGMDKRKKDTSSGSGSSNENCEVKTGWEERVRKAQEHMSLLDEHVQTIHDAKLLTTAYFSIIDKIKSDVENGQPMKAIVANARKAGQKGAQVVVEKTGDRSPNASHPTAGEKEEVQVTVQLEGLKSLEDEDHDPAHSKESFPKVYIYLLGLLLPLCCLIVCLTLYGVLRKPRSRSSPSHLDDKGSMPVEAATLGKDGSTRVHF